MPISSHEAFSESLSSFERYLPNIIISGSPGTGKTTICKLLLNELNKIHQESNDFVPWKYLNISQLVIENKLYREYDQFRECYVISKSKLKKYIENNTDLEFGGYIIETHSLGDMKRYATQFDIIFVIRCDNTILYDRLEKERGYTTEKVQENVQAEIFGICLEDATKLKKKNEKLKITEIDNSTIESQPANLKIMIKEIII